MLQLFTIMPLERCGELPHGGGMKLMIAALLTVLALAAIAFAWGKIVQTRERRERSRSRRATRQQVSAWRKTHDKE